MRRVTVHLTIALDLRVEDEVDIDDAINELDYSFNTSHDNDFLVNVWDYTIIDQDIITDEKVKS